MLGLAVCTTVALLVLVALGVAIWWGGRRFRQRIPNGDLRAWSHGALSQFLLREYDQGRMRPDVLQAISTLAFPPTTDELNVYVVVNVAAGRYRESLALREHWKLVPDALMLINEAEALACLGRFEESLAHVANVTDPRDWIVSGLACHRAWVFAELGRLNEARALIDDPQFDTRTFHESYKAERDLTRFAVFLAAKDFALAQEALNAAQRRAVRESTRRNVAFFRGMLALAEGRDADALPHFERGAQSPYKSQGGACLLAWGDALRRLGRKAEARERWTWCLEQDPQSPAAASARTRLEQA